MGITDFYGRFLDPNYSDAVVLSIEKQILSLFIDSNGIFHRTSQEVYAQYPKTQDDISRRTGLSGLPKPVLQKRHIDLIIRTIDGIVKKFDPRDNLILAPDGIANMAKISQQKTRRYKSIVDSINAGNIFDSNAITPATDLMFAIDEAIQKYFSITKDLPRKVIYSSHMVPGEGEHKIFSYIRNEEIIYNPQDDGAHVVFGLDGDLIVLSLLSPINGIYLVREDEGQIIDIDRLRKVIVKDLAKTKDSRIAMQDFALLVSFVGNDFLPEYPSFYSTNDSMRIVMEQYKNLSRPLTLKGGNIDWEMFRDLVEMYTVAEKKMFERHVRNPVKYPYKEFKESTDSSRKFDKKKFTKLWYCKEFCPKTITPEVYFTPKDIGNMVIDFLKTIQWYLFYYIRGFEHVSNTWFYHYTYAPMADSVLSILNQLLKIGKTEALKKDILTGSDAFEITAVHQLLVVIPPLSKHLIPKKYLKVYETRIFPQNPVGYKIKHEGTNKDWKQKPVLPKINIIELDAAINIMGEIDRKYDPVSNLVYETSPKRVKRYSKKKLTPAKKVVRRKNARQRGMIDVDEFAI